MGWLLTIAVVASTAAYSPTTTEKADSQAAELNRTEPGVLAQMRIGKIIQGLGKGSPNEQYEDDDRESPARPPQPRPDSPGVKWKWKVTPTHPGSEKPNWPGYKPGPWPKPRPGYYPPEYIPQPEYTPVPNYIPSDSTVTPVPPNVLPTEPTTVEPEVNVVEIEPEPNNFLDQLDIKVITPQQVEAFKKQLAQKNKQLGEDLKKLLPGNDKLIDQFVAAAGKGGLDAPAVQKFIAGLGKNLGLQVQLRATGLIKRLIFNNLAMGALLNINLNLLNINAGSINISINFGGGMWNGFWGFPHWPWKYPIWLGPGVWWGPCGCVVPYYNPYLNGAAVLGIPYSLASPVAGYRGGLIAKGILLTNAGDAKVNYTIGPTHYSLNPNYRQVVPRNRIIIAFDRGGSFGKAKYSIDEGWYEFTPTDRGWELYEKTAEITLENSDNPFSFNYVLNNQPYMLKPGYKQKHADKYPMELKFSNGKGQTVRKLMTKGEFNVAVDSSGGLDLFKPSDVTMPAPIAQMSQKLEKETQNIFAKPEAIPNLFGETKANAAPAKPADFATPSLFGP